MTPEAFHKYLRAQIQRRHAAYIPDSDPAVEYYDGVVRVFDQRGESCSLRPYPRHLRQLATMLELVADEMERRGYEQ